MPAQERPPRQRLLRDDHRDCPHLKRRALDDSEDDRREAVVLRARVADDLADGRRVVVLDAAAEREGQQLLGERADEQLRTLQQRRFEPVDAVELAAVGQAAGRVDRLAVLERRASGRRRRSSRATKPTGSIRL